MPGPDPSPLVISIDDIEEQLRSWHVAADEGDFDAYFSRMTPNAVFLGTDRSERWTRPEFEAFSRPYFDGENAWTYEQVETSIGFSSREFGRRSLNTAWIDEVLWNEKYGYCRGTGMMTRDEDGAWLIHRYSLSILVPNDKSGAVMEAIGPQPRPAED